MGGGLGADQGVDIERGEPIKWVVARVDGRGERTHLKGEEPFPRQSTTIISEFVSRPNVYVPYTAAHREVEDLMAAL